MKNTTPYRKKGNHSISSTDALLMDTSEMIESSSNDSNMSGENEKEPYDSHEDFMLIIIAVIGCMFPGVGFFITISITGTLVFHYRAGDFCQISVPFTVVIRCRTYFADIQNKKECGGNRQWLNHYLRNWAANMSGKEIT